MALPRALTQMVFFPGTGHVYPHLDDIHGVGLGLIGTPSPECSNGGEDVGAGQGGGGESTTSESMVGEQ